MMKREYLNENVYEALQRRLKFLFEEFDNIFVSFSGGKDSGLLLNLVLDFQKAHYPDKRIGVFHQDLKRSTALPQNTLRGPLHGSKKMWSRIGSACRWRQGRHSAATKCTGIPGTTPKKMPGSGRCLSTNM